MLSVLSMTLAAVLGSVYSTSMTDTNDYSATLYNTGNCPQTVQYQKGGQDLNSMLSQMGVSMTPGNSQCDIN